MFYICKTVSLFNTIIVSWNLNLVLLFVLILDLPLLTLQMKDCSPLRMIERCGPEKCSENEEKKGNPCHHLQTYSPSDGTGNK